MIKPPAESWRAIGTSEPYYGVLTDERFLRAQLSAEALDEFFATGEADAALIVDLGRRVKGQDLNLGSVLDFGCGVGRLAIPLARRSVRVIGVDIAPAMLALAREHVTRNGLKNVTLMEAEEMAALDEESLDLVCSLLVFQHIPPADGYRLLDRLLSLVKPGGAVALQFIIARSGGPLRRIARLLRSRLALVHRIAQAVSRDRLRLPYMEMNAYDSGRILAKLGQFGFSEMILRQSDAAGLASILVVAVKDDA